MTWSWWKTLCFTFNPQKTRQISVHAAKKPFAFNPQENPSNHSGHAKKNLCRSHMWFEKFFDLQIFLMMVVFIKGKSPEVMFHGITSPYSYFEEIWISAPIQQEAKHEEKLSAKVNWKVCWQSPAMFCLFTHQAQFKFAAEWSWFLETLLNLSHLYYSDMRMNCYDL